ncbi:serine hydrolase domain-containing protein [Seonamhaeicola marinus]|uniref:Beta-lactamase family protein n=1 Tax=Seonamhaeicola marinus TaxID=1912246 RepID=A0A5D0I4U2_9FLAO|nr:serine hydrolase domain-containing protein [Seonamhaeicola marinus]TYA78716.1 beta-lactamase family protein [Seonamhaeicola marinus]
MKRTLSRTLIFAVLTVNTLTGQDIQVKQIDSLITTILKDFKEIPGLSISVVKDEKPFFTKAYGYSNLRKQTKATVNTPYYIASVTKSFVGLLAAKLETDGIINLDTSITNYHPIKDFKDTSIFENVTIRELLSHRSGIRNDLLTWKFSAIGDYDYSTMIYLLKKKTKPLYNDKRYRYDNLGYNIFDIILHEELGLSWKKLLEKELFNPLGMNHTSANISTAIKMDWSPALPYVSINENGTPREALTKKNDETFQAAGGVISSIVDMQKFLMLYMRMGSVNDKKVFSDTLFSKTLFTYDKKKEKKDIFTSEGYGLGWNKGQFKDKKVFYHFGGFDGYFAHLSFLPKENIGMVILTNESHFGDNVSNLIASLIYDLLTKPYKIDIDYTEQIKKLRQRINKIQKAFKRDRELRSHRNWTLMHSFQNYAGTYINKLAGNLVITADKAGITVNLGISKAIASPSSNDESIRVEFRDGRGRDVLFISNDGGTMAAVYNGYVFLKQL